MTMAIGFEMLFDKNEVDKTNKLIQANMSEFLRLDGARDGDLKPTKDYVNASFTYPAAPGMPKYEVPPFNWHYRIEGKYAVYTYLADVSPTSKGWDALPYVMRNIFLSLASILEPIVGFEIRDSVLTDAESEYEYFRDSFMFCANPWLKGMPLSRRFEFMTDSSFLNEVALAKKTISKQDLVKIIRKHCKKTVAGKLGIGIYKGKYDDHECSVVPRFFIREELRRRGVNLKEGFVEAYVKKFGLPVRGMVDYEAYLELGGINDNFK